jgi:hypothetical protein
MAFLDAGLAGLGEEIFSDLKTYGRARIAVSSSAITALTYLPDCTLAIEFTDGSRYAISDFPPPEFARWLSSLSKGGYFNAHIRGKF